MQLTIKNNLLSPIQEFLNSLTLSGAQANIARVRVIVLLTAKINEMEQDRMVLIKQYANLDDKGEPIIVGDKYDVPTDKMAELNQAVVELQSQDAIINVDEYQEQIKNLRSALSAYDEPLNGQQAQILVNLLDTIKKGDK